MVEKNWLMVRWSDGVMGDGVMLVAVTLVK
jgi:hypothetical protein